MIEGVESMRGTASMDRKRNLIVGGGAVAALAGLYLLVADDRSGDAPALAQRAAAAPAQKRAKEIADMTTPPALPAESGRSSDCLIEPSRVVRVNSGGEGVVENGRASCRERVCQNVKIAGGAVSLKKKNK